MVLEEQLHSFQGSHLRLSAISSQRMAAREHMEWIYQSVGQETRLFDQIVNPSFIRIIFVYTNMYFTANYLKRFMASCKVKTKFINYKAGGPQNMFVDEREIEVSKDQYLMKVKAVGLNRAECLHRQGKYNSTKEIEKYLGLEASGEIIDPATNLKLFDGMALLSGGSYAEYASIPKSHVIPLPKSFSKTQGAAIPQAWLTEFQIIKLASLPANGSLVIYASASGVGTAAIQICSILNYNVFAVVSSEEKANFCKQLGAKGVAIYRNNPQWAQDLIKSNNGNKFNAVLDCVGQENVANTIKLLQIDGKWVLFGLLSGPKTEMNLALLLGKRISLISTTLKTRSDDYKTQLINNFTKQILNGFDESKIKPIIYQTLKCDWKSSQAFIQGHKVMENNLNTGKILIQFQ